MGFIDNLAARAGYMKAPPGMDVSGLGDALRQALGTSIGQRPDHSDMLSDIYAASVWVYAGVYSIAMNISMVPLRAGRVEGDEFRPLPDSHPLARLLRQPNPHLTGQEMIETTAAHAEMTGAAYLLKERSAAGLPRELWPLNPEKVGVKAVGNDPVGEFVYRVATTPIIYPPADIVYHRYIDPRKPWLGLSPLLAARLSVKADNSAAEYNRAFFENDASPRGVLRTDQKGPAVNDPNWRKAMLDGWSQAFQGTKRAHRVALLTGGLKYEPVQVPISDMQFAELRKMNREEILAALGVPPIMVGILEGNTFANAEQQMRQFWHETILPKLRKLEAVLTAQLAADFEPGLVVQFDISQVEALNESQQDKAKLGQVLVESGQWTPNEVRERLWQMEALPDGDALHVPGARQEPSATAALALAEKKTPALPLGILRSIDDFGDSARASNGRG